MKRSKYGPFKGIAVKPSLVESVLATDVERLRLFKKQNSTNNNYMKALVRRPSLFPGDHFLATARLGTEAVHGRRWFHSPFDFHSNKQIDSIIDMCWSINAQKRQHMIVRRQRAHSEPLPIMFVYQ